MTAVGSLCVSILTLRCLCSPPLAVLVHRQGAHSEYPSYAQSFHNVLQPLYLCHCRCGGGGWGRKYCWSTSIAHEFCFPAHAGSNGRGWLICRDRLTQLWVCAIHRSSSSCFRCVFITFVLLPPSTPSYLYKCLSNACLHNTVTGLLPITTPSRVSWAIRRSRRRRHEAPTSRDDMLSCGRTQGAKAMQEITGAVVRSHLAFCFLSPFTRIPDRCPFCARFRLEA